MEELVGLLPLTPLENEACTTNTEQECDIFGNSPCKLLRWHSVLRLKSLIFLIEDKPSSFLISLYLQGIYKQIQGILSLLSQIFLV